MRSLLCTLACRLLSLSTRLEPCSRSCLDLHGRRAECSVGMPPFLPVWLSNRLATTCWFFIAVVLSSAGAWPRPQSAGTPAPAFESASIKPAGPRSNRLSAGGPGSPDPIRYYFHSATLLDLVAVAYDVDYFQVSSRVPLDRARFDLDATVPKGATRLQFRQMLQHLLAERFHLKLHHESREFSASVLVQGKAISKLEESGRGPAAPFPNASNPFRDTRFPDLPPDQPGIAANNSIEGDYIAVRLSARHEPISELARLLQSLDEPPVVDQTGLTGRYNFQLEFAKELPGIAGGSPRGPSTLPDLPSALQEQLGLRLVNRRVPFDVIVIDSAAKQPTEN